MFSAGFPEQNVSYKNDTLIVNTKGIRKKNKYEQQTLIPYTIFKATETDTFMLLLRAFDFAVQFRWTLAMDTSYYRKQRT